MYMFTDYVVQAVVDLRYLIDQSVAHADRQTVLDCLARRW